MPSNPGPLVGTASSDPANLHKEISPAPIKKRKFKMATEFVKRNVVVDVTCFRQRKQERRQRETRETERDNWGLAIRVVLKL